MNQHIPNRAPSHPYGKTAKMITRTALLSFALSTTALISATAHASPDTLTPPSLVQSNLTIDQTAPKLNVGLAHGGFTALPTQVLTFKTYWNYDRFIFLGEVRVFKASDKELSTPLEVIPVKRDEPTQWTPKGSIGEEFIYVLRVYGHDGLYDETHSRQIRLSDRLQTAAEALSLIHI